MSMHRVYFYAVVIVPGTVLMALEMVSSRLLAPQFGNSVYVWGSIIGVFLAAMSVGYYQGGRMADRRPSLAALGRLLLMAAAAQAVVLLVGRSVTTALGEMSGGAPWGTLLVTGLLFGPPTALLATVSPYAVKLATRELDLLGGVAGHLYALSTAGSLVGVLGATFVLIPNLALDTILRLLLVVTVINAVAAMLSAWRNERAGLLFAVGLLVVAAVPEQGAPRGLLAQRMTPYQTLRVFDDDAGVRYLQSDGTLQSAVEIATGEPAMAYARQAPTALLLNENLEDVLVLGMGAGSVGSYLRSHLPEARIEYVEIDPAVAELARDLMFFTEDERLRVHVDDGRRFLTSHPDRRWDYIYVDVYIGHSMPFHLSTVEFFAAARRHLNPGGVLGLNIIADIESPFGSAMLRTLHGVFGRVYVFGVQGTNHLLLATDMGEPPDREGLAAAAAALSSDYSFEPTLVQMAGWLEDVELELGEALLFTDEFAPVNHLVRATGSVKGFWRRDSESAPPSEP